jgi:hypothetical protein
MMVALALRLIITRIVWLFGDLSYVYAEGVHRFHFGKRSLI